MGLALEVGGESKEGFNYDYPIEINEQSLEKTNNSYIVSTDRIHKTGWVSNNSDNEIISLLKYC